MARLPIRNSLPAQAAEIIQELIKDGEIKDRLPGERTLASRLQIGRDTLRASLEILETEGWISPREHGKRRSILKQTPRPNEPTRSNRVAFLSPKRLQDLPPWMLVEFDITKSLLNQQGYKLELVSPGLFHLQRPERKLQALLADTEADAWILYQCPPQVQRWFHQKKIPALVRGYPSEGLELPAIDEDWNAAAYHAGGILKRNGHRSIGILLPDVALAGLKAAREGLAKAVESGPEPGSLTILIDRREPDSVSNALEKAFTSTSPPTALVLTRSRHVLTVLSWLAARRLRIPEDLSIVVLSHDSWFEHLIPSITHYHLTPESTARATTRKIQRILNGRSSDPDLSLLIPDCIEGRSVRRID